MQNVFFLVIVFLGLVVLQWQNYVRLAKDAEAGPTDLSLGEWIKHTLIELICDIVLFVAFCLKVDLGLGEKLANLATHGDSSTANSLSFAGAIAIATLIYKTVQLTILPLINGLLKLQTARKLLRNKVAEAGEAAK